MPTLTHSDLLIWRARDLIGVSLCSFFVLFLSRGFYCRGKHTDEICTLHFSPWDLRETIPALPAKETQDKMHEKVLPPNGKTSWSWSHIHRTLFHSKRFVHFSQLSQHLKFVQVNVPSQIVDTLDRPWQMLLFCEQTQNKPLQRFLS